MRDIDAPPRAGEPVSVPDDLAAEGFEDAQEVGRGGFGVVYRCVQRALGRTVAVKVLPGGVDDENRERFLREEYAMGRLSGHPNIVTVLQAGVSGYGRPYIVMPYYAGDSLDTRVRRDGPMPWERAVRLGIKLAGALETAHRAGILHRDVKPANVMMTEYGEPQLTDFGIAHIAGGFETVTGVVTGSVAFLAPELLSGTPASISSDVYGLGATLQCLLVGKAAFERRPGEELPAQFARICAGRAPDLRGHGVPEEVCTIVERAMSADPSYRPAAAELGDELRQAERRLGVDVAAMAVPDPLSESPARDEAAPAEHPGRGGDATLRTVPRTATATVRRRPSRPIRLPVELSSFVGRHSELRAVEQLLGAARLVTLTGPGGVGKTRLAVHLARGLDAEFGGRVWLVALSNVVDENLLCDTVAERMGLGDEPVPTEDPERALAARVAEVLGAQPALLVLDSCEHLIPRCRVLAEQLLQAAEGLRLLVTSRQVLGIAGEHVYAVEPLPAGREAVDLFLDRARGVLGDVEFDAGERAATTQLCARLDGIPLAIELAAARLRTFDVHELLELIEDRYRLYTTGSGAADPRHHTLEAMVEWSYRLLDAEEQQVWAMASVFAGEFTAAAAAEVCGAGLGAPEMRLILASLVDKSMLLSRPDRAGRRFRILATLREYGRRRLEEMPERDRCVDRFVGRIARLAADFRRDWFGPNQLAVFREVHRERENIRAALAYSQESGQMTSAGASIAAALHFYWQASCTLTEARRWLAGALESGVVEEATRARVLWSAAVLAMEQNDLDAARDLAERARELTTRIGDRSGQGYAAIVRGFVAMCDGDEPARRACYAEALRCQREAGDPEGITSAIAALLAGLPRGDEQAARLWQEAVAMCAAVGEQWTLAYLMFARGYEDFRVGDLDRAGEHERESVRLAGVFSDRIVLSWSLEVLSWVAAERADYESSARLRGAAAVTWASAGAALPGRGDMHAHHVRADLLTRAALGDARTDELMRSAGRARISDIVADAAGSGR